MYSTFGCTLRGLSIGSRVVSFISRLFHDNYENSFTLEVEGNQSYNKSWQQSQLYLSRIILIILDKDMIFKNNFDHYFLLQYSTFYTYVSRMINMTSFQNLAICHAIVLSINFFLFLFLFADNRITDIFTFDQQDRSITRLFRKWNGAATHAGPSPSDHPRLTVHTFHRYRQRTRGGDTL